MTSKRDSADDAGKLRKRTTVSLKPENGENLSELADRMKMSIDDLYVSLGFAEVVRKKLVEMNRQRLKDLENQKPGKPD